MKTTLTDRARPRPGEVACQFGLYRNQYDVVWQLLYNLYPYQMVMSWYGDWRNPTDRLYYISLPTIFKQFDYDHLWWESQRHVKHVSYGILPDENVKSRLPA